MNCFLRISAYASVEIGDPGNNVARVQTLKGLENVGADLANGIKVFVIVYLQLRTIDRKIQLFE